ncbi:putative acetyltransferase [Mycobacterium avium MAV_120709_2344]|uniref:hypothetical protein n=1 Tax=Mycobacterium avium TaxID=1764 RepID=UPI000448FA23|nr:hypothetical protein [Mycobacterium avium]ETZ51371.1 putative acetyltransferase [Mycobacterium avium MAV_120709_2344]
MLNEWLRTKALHNQREGGSRTWVVLDGRRVVAFYASSTAVLMRSRATKRGLLAISRTRYLRSWLGGWAVDANHQGVVSLQHFSNISSSSHLEVAELTGSAAAVVHANNDTARRFYLRYGFEPSPVDDLTLMLLVKTSAQPICVTKPRRCWIASTRPSPPGLIIARQ